MTRGALLFAFNTETVDYYSMAIATAKRIKHFLGLETSVITDRNTNLAQYDYQFENVFFVDSDKSNTKNKKIWINKGRFQAYDLSPYDETLLLDTDYLINSSMLLKLFDICEDYLCPNKTLFLMRDTDQELVSPTSYPTLWATVILFKKTNKSKQLFESIKMIQNNYKHYAELYGMYSLQYRNDYALTIAHRIIHGHIENKTCYIPWSLVHVDQEIEVFKETNDLFNTCYKMVSSKYLNGKNKKQYILVKDTDFHCLSKKTYMDII